MRAWQLPETFWGIIQLIILRTTKTTINYNRSSAYIPRFRLYVLYSVVFGSGDCKRSSSIVNKVVVANKSPSKYRCTIAVPHNPVALAEFWNKVKTCDVLRKKIPPLPTKTPLATLLVQPNWLGAINVYFIRGSRINNW